MKGLPTGLVIVAVLLVAWLWTSHKSETSKAPHDRVTKELEIDANVMSPTFGEPIDPSDPGEAG